MRFKKLFSGIIAAAMISTVSASVVAKNFPDSDAHWAKDAVNIWSDRNVIKGDDAGNFRPNDPITRAETATVLDNLISYEKTSAKVFSDVGVNDWYALQISHLYQAGVITGYEDGTVRPTSKISRQEAAVMIGRALGLDTRNVNLDILNQFSDKDLIQTWAKPVVALMAERGYIRGNDGAFRPADQITRAEIVTIVNNMVGIYADGSQATYSGDYGNKIAIIKQETTFNGIVLGGAVVSPALKGKVNFNSGSKINGMLYNLSPSASVSIAGATVAATSSPNGGIISSGGNSNYSYNSNNLITGTITGGGGGGSTGGGGGGGSSSSKTYSVVFNANGGTFAGTNSSTYLAYYTSHAYLASGLPSSNPTREGYEFAGWFVTKDTADTLNNTYKIDVRTAVTSSMNLYAGWISQTGKNGLITLATDAALAFSGKTVSDLMPGVIFSETSETDVYKVVGTLKYAEGLVGADGVNGNFIALTYTLPEDIAPENVLLTSGYDGIAVSTVTHPLSASNKSCTRIFSITPTNKTKDIIFTVDLDGVYVDEYMSHTIKIDISELVLGADTTADVATEAELRTALADENITTITVTQAITLADYTYATADGQPKKELILNDSLIVPENATVTIKNLDIKTSLALASAIKNATATTATSVSLEENNFSGDFATVIDSLKTNNLVIKNNTFTGNESNIAIVPSIEAGDTVEISGNTFDKYLYALIFAENAPLVPAADGTNILSKNIFLDNATDIKLDDTNVVPGNIPSVAYNYYKDGAIINDGDGNPATAITAPAYTNDSCTILKEIINDSYLFVVNALSSTLKSDDNPTSVLPLAPGGNMQIVIVPQDIRNSNKIFFGDAIEFTNNAYTVEAAGDLTVKVGHGDDAVTYTITVTE